MRLNVELNKRIARHWFDLISEGAIEELCDITHSSWVIHGALPGLPPGPAGVRKLFGSFGRIEQVWTIDMMIAEGDLVVVRATNTCQQHSFLGIPSQGRLQVFSATFIFRIEHGMVMETWRNADDLGRLLQLGARIEPSLLRVHPAQ